MKLNQITCISDLYYIIGHWFTFLSYLLAFSILPLALECSDGIWSFVMCGGIAFVGAAANYKDRFTYPIHYISAIVSSIGCLIFSWIVYFPTLICLGVGIIGVIDKKRWLLYTELGFFLSAFLSILSHFLLL